MQSKVIIEMNGISTSNVLVAEQGTTSFDLGSRHGSSTDDKLLFTLSPDERYTHILRTAFLIITQ